MTKAAKRGVIPAKSGAASAFTDRDLAVLRSPSVEEHLWEIRRALALATALTSPAAEHAADLPDACREDALEAVKLLCEDAWQRTVELSDSLDTKTMNLHIVANAAAPDAEVR